MKVYDGGEDELVDVDLEEGNDGEAAVLSTRNDPLSKSLQVRGRMGEVMYSSMKASHREEGVDTS